MKTIFLAISLLLASCTEKSEEKDNFLSGDKPAFTVLKATVDANDISDLSIFCIDGVKYLVVPGIGITVKYYHDGSNDPYPETCVNQPVKN